MTFTIFTVRKRGLRKIYSQMEIQEQNLELLYYSPFFRLAGVLGRPRTIWHESTLNDYVQQSMYHERYNRKYSLEYLEQNSVFSHKWIEKDEFYQKIVSNEKLFDYAGFGE